MLRAASLSVCLSAQLPSRRAQQGDLPEVPEAREGDGARDSFGRGKKEEGWFLQFRRLPPAELSKSPRSNALHGAFCSGVPPPQPAMIPLAQLFIASFPKPLCRYLSGL